MQSNGLTMQIVVDGLVIVRKCLLLRNQEDSPVDPTLDCSPEHNPSQFENQSENNRAGRVSVDDRDISSR